MKQLVSYILVLIIVLSFAACNSTEQSSNTLSDAYLKVAQEMIEQGDYTSAISSLEEGYSITQDPALQTLLEEAIKLNAQSQETSSTTESSAEPTTEPSTTPEDTSIQTQDETEPIIPDESENPFGVEGLIKLDLSSVEWVNYGIQEYGTEPTYHPGLRISSNMILDVPYEAVTLYIKINSPYELGIRSGETATKMVTNHYWLNNRQLVSGDKNKGCIYTLPDGHQKFIISIANISRDNNGDVSSSKNPISLDELSLAGLEIWYEKPSTKPSKEPTTAPEETSTPTEKEPIVSNYPIQIDVNDMLSANLLDATFYSAYEDGWLGEWMFLYVHGSSDPSVKYNALWFDDELGQLTYYGILYKQALDSGWGDIWLDMTTRETVSTEAVIDETDTPDLFIGTWIEHSINTEGYGLALTIEQYDEESLLVTVNQTSDPLGSRVVLFDSIIPYDLFFDDAVDFSFDNDGWDNAGRIQLQMLDNEILCIVYDVNYIGEEGCPMWGIRSDEYLLNKD